MKKIKWSLLLAVCLTQAVLAAPLCIPLAPLKTQNKNILLSVSDEPKAAQIYILKNISAQSIWLDHPSAKTSASAGWSSYLRPGRASALLLNRKNFAISCAVIKPGSVDYQECAKGLSVCVLKSATIKTARKGTYWLAEDLPQDGLMKMLIKRGVTF